MREERLKNRAIRIVFYSVTILLTAQVIWWAAAFVSHVNELSAVKKLLVHSPDEIALIEKEAFHKRVMFLSESAFFLLAAGFGIIALYRALRVEERARAAQKNFVEIMSHESKTPVTALKLRLESLSEKRGSDAEVVKELRSALLEVRRLSSLFDKAMSLSRAEQEAFHVDTLSVLDLVKSVVNRMEPVLRDRHVDLSVDIDDKLMVEGDLTSLQSSVQSLLENAVYYNEKPTKKVRVSASLAAGRVTIAIDDDGPGIGGEDTSRVFEKFYRGEKQTSVPGSGLGLFLARKVALAHHGDLRVTSSSLGGARFCMELPASHA